MELLVNECIEVAELGNNATLFHSYTLQKPLVAISRRRKYQNKKAMEGSFSSKIMLHSTVPIIFGCVHAKWPS